MSDLDVPGGEVPVLPEEPAGGGEGAGGPHHHQARGDPLKATREYARPVGRWPALIY